MKYRKFGKLDWNISEVSLGCWAIGADWGHVSEEVAKEAEVIEEPVKAPVAKKKAPAKKKSS